MKNQVNLKLTKSSNKKYYEYMYVYIQDTYTHTSQKTSHCTKNRMSTTLSIQNVTKFQVQTQKFSQLTVFILFKKKTLFLFFLFLSTTELSASKQNIKDNFPTAFCYEKQSSHLIFLFPGHPLANILHCHLKESTFNTVRI